jgi:hypothetical protein
LSGWALDKFQARWDEHYEASGSGPLWIAGSGDLEWNDYDLCFPIADLYENKNIGTSNDDSNAAA